jgi:hypothetical protein
MFLFIAHITLKMNMRLYKIDELENKHTLGLKVRSHHIVRHEPIH